MAEGENADARLQDKVAIVSGAGSSGPGWGNGKATAVLFARQGARVLCADINLEAAEETADIIRDEGGEAVAVTCDVSLFDQVEGMIETCRERFGRIDILHNNVGILGLGGPVDHDIDEWDKVYEVNVKSMFLTCKAVIPVMEAQGGGAIVNISSIASTRWIGVPFLSYASSKAAIVQLTKMIAAQYAAKNIRCNTILPGLMDTPMVHQGLAGVFGDGDIEKMIQVRASHCPTGKMGDAWDVAHAALYLASDEAKYVTGVELVVDGGLSLRSVT